MQKFIFLFIFFCHSINAQLIEGVVRDQKTRKPLQFASIFLDNNTSLITEIDGKFSFHKKDFQSFSVSYLGYEIVTVKVSKNRRFYTIYLSQIDNNLDEIIIKQKPSTLSIIQKAIANTQKNDPLEQIQNFDFKTYTKLIVTANPDSISSKIDTIYKFQHNVKAIKKIDSSSYKFKNIVSKHHLFQTEKLSQYQYTKPNLKENILGSKMAGFKQPIYEFLSFNLQSFSIYDNYYELFETKYINPIAKRAPNIYDYKLLDTIKIQNRSVYLIYFKDKRKTVGLEGALFIDTENYAIAKANMRIIGVINISGIHEFEYIDTQKLWFPKRKIFRIIKGKNDQDIKILGGTIKFEGDADDGFLKRKKEVSDFVYLISESSNFDINFNTIQNIKRPSIAIEIKEKAITHNEEFWNKYRSDSLDNRSEATYKSLDSIAIKNRVENKIIFGRKFINGFLPVGNIDFDLRKFFNYNNYEGFRFCPAVITNEGFSKKNRIEGYVAYGTKDSNFKYNLGTAVRVGKTSNSWIGVSYTDDIQEIASTKFAVEKQQNKLFDSSLFNTSAFYNFVSWKSYIETKIIPKTISIWEVSHTIVEPKFDYLFFVNNKNYNVFNMTTAQVSIQWSPFSNFMQTPIGRFETEKKFPKFTLQINKSIPKIINNDFDFTKIDCKIEFERKYLDGQLTNIIFATGYAIGDTPLTHLYNNSPNSLNKNTLLQRFTIDGENDFETMYFNEFFSSQFAYFQFKHEFRRFQISNKIKPGFAFVSRAAIGTLNNMDQHKNINFKTLEKGYLESGVQLNYIFKGFGLDLFYRYGPNALSDFADNLALRFNFKVDVGF